VGNVTRTGVMCGVKVDDGEAFRAAIRNEYVARYGLAGFQPAQMIHFAYTRVGGLAAGEFTEAEYTGKWGGDASE